MRYYVVNSGHGRSTHITREPIPGLAVMLLTGAPSTLCGLAATRQVDVFTPAEVSCRKCRRRWELAPQPKPVMSRNHEQAAARGRAVAVLMRPLLVQVGIQELDLAVAAVQHAAAARPLASRQRPGRGGRGCA